MWNVVNPAFSTRLDRWTANRKVCLWEVGKGPRRKQMPGCNGRDSRLNRQIPMIDDMTAAGNGADFRVVFRHETL
jgi:hypothetical protein